MSSSMKKPTIVATCHGVDVPDSPMITPTRIERINACRYEGQEIAGALEVIQPGDHVLEMGSGLGLVGAIAAKCANPARVISFEANPQLIPHIEALYQLNALGEKIEVRNQVLMSAPDRPETEAFFIRTSYLGSSLIEAEDRPTTRVEVPTADYEALRQDFAPSVLLIDIEGGELEFLRHANLDGLRAVVIEFHPSVYGKSGMRECKRILEDAGFGRNATHSTRLVWTCVRDTTTIGPDPDDGWSRKVTAHDKAIVVPPVESGMVQKAGVLDTKGQYIHAAALWRNGRPLTEAPQFPTTGLTERKGTWLWGGVLWMHFGHFLAESMSRLWALPEIAEQIDGVLFIPKRPRNGAEVIDFQQQSISLFGKDIPVACADGPQVVERLIVPGQGFGLGQMITGTPEFRSAVQTHFAKDVPAEGPEKLYISRSKLPAGRGNLIGETVLEAYLEAAGYTIYHPEKHDLLHQIATYKAAKQVIAAEGSALHLLAMVAAPGTQVAIVVRRPSGATRNLERHLHSFTGIEPDTIVQLTRSWKPKGAAKSRLWMGELDMPALQAELAASGYIPKTGAIWENLSPSEVQERLGSKFVKVA